MAKVLTTEESAQLMGITVAELGQLEKDASNGILHGVPQGEVMRGRPLLFGQETQQVGFREPLKTIDAIDRRAKQLDMKRSDYLRHLVSEDLKLAGIA